jgi:hypothetical protein
MDAPDPAAADEGRNVEISSADAGMAALDRLRGLMRDEFAEYCGGEAFLRWLRADPEPEKRDEL